MDNNTTSLEKKHIKVLDVYDLIFLLFKNLHIIIISTIIFLIFGLQFDYNEDTSYSISQKIKIDKDKQSFFINSKKTPLDVAKIFLDQGDDADNKIEFSNLYPQYKINSNALSSNLIDPDSSIDNNDEYYLTYQSTDEFGAEVIELYTKFIIDKSETKIGDKLRNIYSGKQERYARNLEKANESQNLNIDIAITRLEQKLLNLKDQLNIAKVVPNGNAVTERALTDRPLESQEWFLYGPEIITKKIDNIENNLERLKRGEYLSKEGVESKIKFLRATIDRDYEEFEWYLKSFGISVNVNPLIFKSNKLDIVIQTIKPFNMLPYIFASIGIFLGTIFVIAREGIRNRNT